MNTVLYHGRITTMDPENPVASAVLIQDDKLQAVGTDDFVLSMVQPGPDTQYLDLQGAAVYPGLTDTHMHLLSTAIASHELQLNGIRTRQGILDAVARKVRSLPEGAVLNGRGYNEDLWTDSHAPLTRRELDLVSQGHPVLLTRVCGHVMTANSCAIQNAGIDESTPVPAGGAMDLLNGIFSENAEGLLSIEHKDTSVENCKTELLYGMQAAADSGLTCVYTDDFGTGGYSMHTVIAAYRQLEQEGCMPVRIVQQCSLPDNESLEQFLTAGYAYGQGSDMYTLGPRKLFSDGSLGAHTAYLQEPYKDMPSTRGIPIYTQEEINTLYAESHAAGMPCITHAIGDGAVDMVLHAIQYARETIAGTSSLPDGIVHCQITTEEQLQRIADMQVCVYAQPVFTEYDLHICEKRTGPALEKSSYNWKTLYSSGVTISSGSDSPVEPFAPATNLYCAITRKDFDGIPEGGWNPSQCLTFSEALACHTTLAARAVHRENRLGMLRKNYLADMSIYPKELSTLDEKSLMDCKPLMTIVGGKIRYCPAGSADA